MEMFSLPPYLRGIFEDDCYHKYNLHLPSCTYHSLSKQISWSLYRLIMHVSWATAACLIYKHNCLTSMRLCKSRRLPARQGTEAQMAQNIWLDLITVPENALARITSLTLDLPIGRQSKMITNALFMFRNFSAYLWNNAVIRKAPLDEEQ